MDKFGSLGSIILFSLVKLLLTRICHSRLVVDLEVSGTYVVRTGVRAYAVRTERNENVLIKCSSKMSITGTILVLNKNGEPVANGVALQDGPISARLWRTHPDERYTCVLNISTWVSSDSYSEFIFTSEVEITTVSFNQWPFCSSSIGKEGYFGEIVIFTCNMVFYSNCYYWDWEDTYKRTLEIDLTENLELTCTCPYYYEKTCFSSILVSQTLYLNLSVVDNSTHPDTMEFLCMSMPPRLMYWKIFGTYGNLLDFDNVGQQVNVNTTVNITQSPGETVLRISETIPGGNGVHTVMCSTYDTEKRVVAFLPIKIPSESSFDFEQSSFKTTDIQETTSSNPTKTVVHSALSITTTETEDNCGKYDIPVSTDLGDLLKKDMKIGSVDIYLLVGFVSLPYLLIISILLATICFVLYRHKNSIQASVAVPSQHIPLETILHENPAYLSFSETKEYISDNEQAEMTYANL